MKDHHHITGRDPGPLGKVLKDLVEHVLFHRVRSALADEYLDEDKALCSWSIVQVWEDGVDDEVTVVKFNNALKPIIVRISSVYKRLLNTIRDDAFLF